MTSLRRLGWSILLVVAVMFWSASKAQAQNILADAFAVPIRAMLGDPYARQQIYYLEQRQAFEAYQLRLFQYRYQLYQQQYQRQEGAQRWQLAHQNAAPVKKPPVVAAIRKPEPPPLTNEERAAIKLKAAKLFLDNGQQANAREYVEEILAKYPHTPAADEAKRLLEQLGPDPGKLVVAAEMKAAPVPGPRPETALERRLRVSQSR